VIWRLPPVQVNRTAASILLAFRNLQLETLVAKMQCGPVAGCDTEGAEGTEIADIVIAALCAQGRP
jgi:hypothetical protein